MNIAVENSCTYRGELDRCGHGEIGWVDEHVVCVLKHKNLFRIFLWFANREKFSFFFFGIFRTIYSYFGADREPDIAK